MAGTSKRVNISLPEKLHALLQQLATDHYGGNLSRYLADAGLFYAAVTSATGGAPMTNYQAKGYVVLAMVELGFSYTQINQMLATLHRLFDTVAEQEAADQGNAVLHRMNDDSQ